MWHYGEVSLLVIILLWRGLPMLCEVTGGTEVALSVSLAVISFSTFHFDGYLCSVLVLFGLHCGHVVANLWWTALRILVVSRPPTGRGTILRDPIHLCSDLESLSRGKTASESHLWTLALQSLPL